MISTHWPDWFKDLYGSAWPTTYLALDLETTGFNTRKDVIVEIGHVLVEGGVVTNRMSLLLDWSDHPVVPASYVRGRLLDVARAMATDGRNWSLTWERLAADGVRPEKALSFYRDLLADWSARGGLFALHNGFFDESMLAHNLAGFGIDAEGFEFPDNQYFDTSSLERVSQCPGDQATLPRAGDTLKSYFKRMKYYKGGSLHSSLDKHCVGKYGLALRPGFEASGLHTADFDAYLVHLLMEEFGREGAREVALEVARGVMTPPTFLGPAASPVNARKRGQRNR